MLAVGVRRQLNSCKWRHLCSASDRDWEHCVPGNLRKPGRNRPIRNDKLLGQPVPKSRRPSMHTFSASDWVRVYLPHNELRDIRSCVAFQSAIRAHCPHSMDFTCATVTDQWVTSEGIEVSKSIMCSVEPVHVNLDHSATVPQSKNACRLLQCRHTKSPYTQQV